MLGCSSESEDEQAGSATSVSTEAVSSSQTSEVSTDESTEESSTTRETETTDNTSESTSSEEDKKEEGQEKDVPIREYSDEEKEEISQEFLDWAIPRAEEGGMAVSEKYFEHGAAGLGDWFANTEDGEIQTQDPYPEEDLPGYDAFDIHSLGGVVFYTSSSGVTGYDETPKESATAEGFSKAADSDYSIHKYILGDNGVVYELIGDMDEIGAFSAGYGEYEDDGESKIIDPEHTFKVSDDEDAQKAWRKILQDYQ
ncbi:hypothetical protein GCM10025886_12660 [Tetragenococcus halophilus subsp. flandriensis]|uniref:hypothetical protein n=1 Tax=Tetragenococcus halophilus TaxID=51669 RepID=UPI0023EA14CD|nr:hypothetical protein [Tetragenococcus halophilus]GMA08115.1 hypothetical protein GCM10025886_12660 [Tetragenococcus halophilus subsp. flandriensis]